jgi:hypothetical protein|tara:strand:+ start:3897 stop:4637 length:741 start_codon:yes stop_codon:yes gene_type:complete
MVLPFEWIDTNNHHQLVWIAAYIERKKFIGSHFFSSWIYDNPSDYSLMVNRLKSLPNEAESRELSRLMRGAWQTDLYRKSRGKQVSFQLPHDTLKQLNTLSKKREQTKVHTLSQIISEAANYQMHATKQVKKERESFHIKIKEQQDSALRVEQAYQGIVNSLMNTLAEELSYRCRLEAFVGGWDDSPLESNDKQTYHDLVEKRVSHTELNTSKLKSLNSYAFPTLRMRMREQAIINGIEESDTGLL